MKYGGFHVGAIGSYQLSGARRSCRQSSLARLPLTAENYNLVVRARGGRSLPLPSQLSWTLTGDPAYVVTLAKIMANVYSAIDSISTSARMSRNWIPGRAPGLRPKPSHAAAVARACA